MCNNQNAKHQEKGRHRLNIFNARDEYYYYYYYGKMEDTFIKLPLVTAAQNTEFLELITTNRNLSTKLIQQED